MFYVLPEITSGALIKFLDSQLRYLVEGMYMLVNLKVF